MLTLLTKKGIATRISPLLIPLALEAAVGRSLPSGLEALRQHIPLSRHVSPLSVVVIKYQTIFPLGGIRSVGVPLRVMCPRQCLYLDSRGFASLRRRCTLNQLKITARE